MAFAAQLGALTDELVEVIASTSAQSEPERFNVLRESSLRKLRHHGFLRTNQFEVQETLDGLQEHFRVLNRDGLADALRDRLVALEPHAKMWTPEALHLLLCLSDQPVQKATLASVELLKEPDDEPPPDLRWRDIAREDGWGKDRGLWENVYFGNISSDNDEDVEDRTNESEASGDTAPSSIEARYRRDPTDYLDSSQDTEALEAIQLGQSWRTNATLDALAGRRPKKVVITELQAVREIFFVLLGLKSSLFDANGSSSLAFQLGHVSWQAYRSLMSSFGEGRRQLSLLRDFVKQRQQVPLLQVFQGAVERRLGLFDSRISGLQAQFVSIEQDIVVSLMRIYDDVKPELRPMMVLADTVREVQHSKHSQPFLYLELLFDRICITQLQGDTSVFNFLSQLFFECFEVYLRPIRLWMEQGDLVESDEVFFVSATPAEVPRRRVWSDQYELRRTAEGALYAPRFLEPAASKIFTTGKTIVVLKLLGKYRSTGEQMPEPSLSFEERGDSSVAGFAPFTETFSQLFEQWMQSKYQAASETLRQALFKTCGLWSVLDALQHIYLMSDGSRSDNFAGPVFNNIDLLNQSWHDRFSLTSIAQEAFDNIADPDRISVTLSAGSGDVDVKNVRRTVRQGLPMIRVAYRLSWPIRIVVSDEALVHYQSAFTLLLQLRRAIYVIHKHRLLSDGLADPTTEQAAYYAMRTKLLWFCGSLQSYLTTLVLEPLSTQLRDDLREAQDIDAMIASHSAFAKRMVDEACLGGKLDPIRECILDVFDLAIKLQDARQFESERVAEEMRELSRSSATSSPANAAGKRYMNTSEEEDETFLSDQDQSAMVQDTGPDQSYAERLREIRADFDRHVKFIYSGLRGVSRATGNPAASKWDMLAEMLEVGAQGH
ncbi:Spc98 family-domain-containing protein [Xylariaceae sp. FL0804]|nr:Spc98 family-domain-containing protein [Xylariaceae sp. FL0804]